MKNEKNMSPSLFFLVCGDERNDRSFKTQTIDQNVSECSCVNRCHRDRSLGGRPSVFDTIDTHSMKLVWSCGFVSFPTAGLLRDAFVQ